MLLVWWIHCGHWGCWSILLYSSVDPECLSLSYILADYAGRLWSGFPGPGLLMALCLELPAVVPVF